MTKQTEIIKELEIKANFKRDNLNPDDDFKAGERSCAKISLEIIKQLQEEKSLLIDLVKTYQGQGYEKRNKGIHKRADIALKLFKKELK